MVFVPITLAVTVLFCCFLERQVKPRTQRRPFHRPRLLAAMPVALFFLCIFMLSYRPIFSAALTLVLFQVLISVNNVKVRAVREPLVYSDFVLLKQVFVHPRLYLSYLGPLQLLAASFGVTAMIWALFIEPPVFERLKLVDYMPVLTFFIVLIGLFYAIAWGPLQHSFLKQLERCMPTKNIEEDMQNFGIITCLILYFFLSKSKSGLTSVASSPWGEMLPKVPMGSMHDIVVVQNESFFDARSVMQRKVGNFLSAYDRICDEALFKGRLEVPAWGANTQRTEYAFLSGVSLPTLGVHQYNPFLSAGLQTQWSLARFLRGQGYRTVCIHPYYKTFFFRDRVYPDLGFEEFLDIAEFEGAERCGPYISDMAVAAKACDVLAAGDGRPVFMFVITMENHGRWEKHGIDINDELRAAAPNRSESFACYLQHLVNADRMVDSLFRVLQKRKRGSVFCFFGDHQPSFPDEFSLINHDDTKTEYFIWKKGATEMYACDVEAHNLGKLLLEALSLQNEVPMVQRTAVGGQ